MKNQILLHSNDSLEKLVELFPQQEIDWDDMFNMFISVNSKKRKKIRILSNIIGYFAEIYTGLAIQKIFDKYNLVGDINPIKHKQHTESYEFVKSLPYGTIIQLKVPSQYKMSSQIDHSIILEDIFVAFEVKSSKKIKSLGTKNPSPFSDISVKKKIKPIFELYDKIGYVIISLKDVYFNNGKKNHIGTNFEKNGGIKTFIPFEHSEFLSKLEKILQNKSFEYINDHYN